MRTKSDTIFALSTPKSKSAIAVFRLTGKDCASLIQKISTKKNIEEKKATLSYLVDKNKNKLDQVVLTFYKGPYSYTGEDMIEISCHGGLATINKISELMINFNIRLAEPGEFTKRALINNKISIIKAETINELVNAETENQRKLAITNLTGGLEKFTEEISNKLSKLLADVEALIDFADEDLPGNTYKIIKEQNKNIILHIQKTLERSLLSKEINAGFNITIIGKPNTGKSSFINYINNRQVSIVTNIPGTTTDLITSSLDINGDKYTFTDTAGIRKFRNLIEKIGIEKSIESAKKSDLTLVFLKNNEKNNYKDIKNKIFIKSKHDKNKAKTKGVRNISSVTGYGIKKLLNDISKRLKKKAPEGAIFSRERHIKNLKDSLNYLKATNFREIDIAADNIRRALISIQNINQKFDIEKILDIIFSDFCIGK